MKLSVSFWGYQGAPLHWAVFVLFFDPLLFLGEKNHNNKNVNPPPRNMLDPLPNTQTNLEKLFRPPPHKKNRPFQNKNFNRKKKKKKIRHSPPPKKWNLPQKTVGFLPLFSRQQKMK